MTKPFKILIAILFLIVAYQACIYLFNFFNPWLGILAGILTLLGVGQFLGLLDFKKIKF